MKKLIPSIVLAIVWSTVLLFYACEKKDLREIGAQLSEAKKTSGRVITWLDEQKLITSKNSATNIDLLKQNLDFENLRFEELNENKKLLIIPIREGLAIQKNIDRTRAYNFVAIVDADNKIVSANVIIYKPDEPSQRSTLPANTFSRLFNSKPLTVDGQFRMLHIGG